MLILSIDGGGARGIIPAVVVEHIVRRISRDFLHGIDLFAGTSAGAILASGYAVGKTAVDVRDLFVSGCKTIFSTKGGSGVFKPLYKIQKARDVLLDAYGYKTFSSVRSGDTNLLVVAFDARYGKPVFFSTIGNKKYDKTFVYDAVLSSMAAPTYFDDNNGYVDGGLIANNPSMCAVIEAMKMSKDIKILSIGTGNVFCGRRHKGNGMIGWGQDIANTFIGASDDVVDYQLLSMLGDNYLRLQCSIEKSGADAMDNVTDDNISYLINCGEDLFYRNEGAITKFIGV